MGLFDKLLGRKQQISSQEAVLIHFDLGPRSNGDYFGFDEMVDLEDKLIEVIECHEVGKVDGHEIGSTDGTIFIYGPDADIVFAIIEPVLQAHPLCKGSRIVFRKGGAGSPETEMNLRPQ